MAMYHVGSLPKSGFSTSLACDIGSKRSEGSADLTRSRTGSSTKCARHGFPSILAAGKPCISKGGAGSFEFTKFPRQSERWNRLVGWKVLSSSSLSPNEDISLKTDNDGGNGFSGHGGGSSGGGGGGDGFGGAEGSGSGSKGDRGGIFGVLLKGWDARVKADAQFPFKVLMEQVVGVGACVIGDMASRPNYGLSELDLVFSTLVVGSLLNFSLMYMLAPTAVAGAVGAKLPGIFSKSPPGHMFEIGSYTLLERSGTFVYKGVQFAVVGLIAGLAGTCLSNALIETRKKIDPSYVPQTATPPLVLNAVTWAAHMGFSSNARYQSLNGLEFALAKNVSPGAFKASVPILRALNNVLGGTTFVMLARVTGAQPKSPTPPPRPNPDDVPMEPIVATS